MKLVSRQFYKETADLEVQFIRIIFDCVSPQESTRRFTRFVDQCTPGKLD
jgi:hypothetical protein